MTIEKTKEEVQSKEKTSEKKQIVIYNDDVNTFDWVIECLMEICNHEYIQAYQCANIIHNNGKCSVKGGSFEELKPKCLQLLNRQLSAVIE
jgi:ATP-dependent Clp protease adaptor protein ClpS